MKETRIYVGLNDAVTMEQKHDTEKYASVLRNVCKSYHVPFSFHLMEGGYMHDDGRYTRENTLVLHLMDVETEVIKEIARDLCAFFNQESVMVAEGMMEVHFIYNRLE